MKKKEINHKMYEFAEKILPVYELFGWTWSDKKPTIESIVKTLEDLLSDVKKGSSKASTGGLYVERDCEIKESISFGMNIHGYSFLEF